MANDLDQGRKKTIKIRREGRTEVRVNLGKGTDDQPHLLKGDTKGTILLITAIILSRRMITKRRPDTDLDLTLSLNQSLNRCQNRNNFILMAEETIRAKISPKRKSL